MKTMIISAGGYQAEIVPDIGGNCIRLEHEERGASLLRTPPNEEALRSKPTVYGMPLLFPTGRIQDGRFSFHGRYYQLPINEPSRNNHLNGFLSDQPFEVVEQSDNFVALRLEWRHNAPFFPHAFEVQRRYSLSAEGLIHEVCFTNTGSEIMPFSLGFHTAFNAPFAHDGKAENIRLCVPVTHRLPLDAKRFLPSGEEPRIDEFCHLLQAGLFCPAQWPLSFYGELAAEVMTLTDIKENMQIVYETPGFPFCMLWNGGGPSGFVCMEPQSCLPDAFNQPFAPSQTEMLALKPQETLKRTQRLAIDNTALQAFCAAVQP